MEPAGRRFRKRQKAHYRRQVKELLRAVLTRELLTPGGNDVAAPCSAYNRKCSGNLGSPRRLKSSHVMAREEACAPTGGHLASCHSTSRGRFVEDAMVAVLKGHSLPGWPRPSPAKSSQRSLNSLIFIDFPARLARIVPLWYECRCCCC